jgi:hypothetical protein
MKHHHCVFSQNDSTGWVVVMPKHDLADYNESDVSTMLRKKWKVKLDFHSWTK